MLVYVVVAVLVPERGAEPSDYEAFFFDIRRRFFRLSALLIVADTTDSVLKGWENLEGLGATYFFRVGVYLVGHLAASSTDSTRYHALWVVIFILLFVGAGSWTADVFGRG